MAAVMNRISPAIYRNGIYVDIFFSVKMFDFLPRLIIRIHGRCI